MERPFRFDDDDDESGGQGENAEGRSGEADHGPSTPRSKHSAMEQRRRSKINDRFQMLRELVPHSDQKRDKASLLLEVIEHIRLLHEKVQKYEPSDPGWTEENSKSMPWGEVYFRSCWKNAQNNCPGPGDGYVDPSQNIKNTSLSPELVHSRNNNIALTSTIAQNPAQPDSSAGGSYKGTENRGFASEVAASSFPHPNLYAYVGTIAGDSQSQQLISDADNIVSLSHTPWLRSPCFLEDTLKEQGLEIDKGTISVSSAYSEGLLTALSETLQNSGIDFSQASISVDINLGKRASNISPTVITTMSNAKDADDRSSGQRAIQHSRVGSCGEDSEQAPKRHKSDNS